jgi:signal transduction histidine kinase
MGRAWTAWRARPVVVRDACLAVALLALLVASVLSRGASGLDPVVAVLVVVGTLSVGWRRASPLVALGLTGIALVGTTVVAGPGSGALAAALVAVYSAVAWDRRLAGTVAAAVEIAGLGLATVVRTGAWRDDEVLLAAALVAIALAAGFAVGSRRTAIDTARERAERAETTREAEAARRVAEERLRIARELHDVLGHHVAVIGVQAGVAETLLASRPEAARTALEHVQDASASVLTELAALVEVLREPGDDARAGPAPGLGGLDELVDDARSTGLDVRVTTDGEPHPLAPVVDLTAYRVVQEALTNAHKHGDGSAALQLTYADGSVSLEVANRVRTGVVEGVGGHGLVGMRERVAAVGGLLEAGADGPTFRVRAVLPVLAAHETSGAVT